MTCDRCGKEIDGYTFTMTLSLDKPEYRGVPWVDKRRDYCEECAVLIFKGVDDG